MKQCVDTRSRRRTLTLGAMLAVFEPLDAGARASKPWLVAYLHVRGASGTPYRQAIEESLRDLGYTGERSVRFMYLESGPDHDELYAAAKQLVDSHPSVIVVGTNTGVAALQSCTRTIPIVVAAARDPVGAGYAASLARPGGNVTGLNSITGNSLGSKRLALMREIAPAVTRVGILYEPQASSPHLLADLRESAQQIGLGLEVLELRDQDGIDAVLAQARARRCDALALEGGPGLIRNAGRIAEFAMRERMPTTYGLRETTSAGLLFSYGVSLLANYRRAAWYVDKLLKGAKPGEMPIEQPVKFELVINLKTASAIGLKVPKSMLLRADEVIE